MINTRNLGTYHLHLRSLGTVTAAANKDAAVVPFDGFIANIVATFSTVTGNTNSVIDLHYLGTTIFGAATKITVSTLSTIPSYSTLSSNEFGVTAGSILSMDVDSVSTTLTNILVDITITKTPPALCTTETNMNLVR